MERLGRWLEHSILCDWMHRSGWVNWECGAHDLALSSNTLQRTDCERVHWAMTSARVDGLPEVAVWNYCRRCLYIHRTLPFRRQVPVLCWLESKWEWILGAYCGGRQGWEVSHIDGGSKSCSGSGGSMVI